MLKSINFIQNNYNQQVVPEILYQAKSEEKSGLRYNLQHLNNISKEKCYTKRGYPKSTW